MFFNQSFCVNLSHVGYIYAAPWISRHVDNADDDRGAKKVIEISLGF